MELEGLKRSLSHMIENGIEIERFITDRHCQVKKFLREEYPEIQHKFDVWHVAKGKQLHLVFES